MFPCADLVDALDVDSFILKGALILDLLWKAKNNKVHGEGFLEARKLMLDFGKFGENIVLFTKVQVSTIG